MKVSVARLPWVLVGIAAALEGVTVAILPYVSSMPADGPVSKPPESGLLLGYLGMLTAIVLANLAGRTAMAERLLGGALHIRNALLVSAWGGIYLALIFFFQGVFDFTPYTTLTVMLRAACSLAASTLAVLLLYRLAVRMVPVLSVRLTLGADRWQVAAVGIWTPVVLLSLYEAVALPVIEQVRQVEDYRLLAGLGLGLLAGALAATCVVAIYNGLSRVLPQARLCFLLVGEDGGAAS
ncbi:MAG: hypothetical protein KDJ88_17270 [Bauldia sp.]|nr:hypothetical protein [Bauldia sp.]